MEPVIVTDIKSVGLRTIQLEAAAIQGLQQMVNDDFERAAKTIAACSGRLVVSGIGKSAIIAQKIVATFNSTGTPSIFLHAADAIHGDLGMIQQNDTVLIISKSGESPEIKVLVPLIRNFGNTLIGMVGNLKSFLAKQSNIVLNTTVNQEACPNNLAPTTSTTAALALGDALAICLLESRNFNSEDFATLHPGGSLGKQLYLKVADIYTNNAAPAVAEEASLKEIIIEISSKRLGATAVLDAQSQSLTGIITDGDLRRMLNKYDSLQEIKARDIMTKAPLTIEAEEYAAAALALMQQKNITQLIVTRSGSFAGFVHVHDLLKEGLI